jgi:hypothetical protein
MSIPNTVEDAVRFLLRWPTRYIVLTRINPKPIDGARNAVTETFEKHKVEALTAWLNEWNGKWNIYFLVNEAREPITDNPATKEQIGRIVCCHVDVDVAKSINARKAEEWNAELERIQVGLEGYRQPQHPSVILFSGGGHQGFRLLIEPVVIKGPDDIARVEACNRRIERDLGGDHCHNINRIMRVPFTWNLPTEKKLGAGRVAVLSGTVGEPDWDLKYNLTADFSRCGRTRRRRRPSRRRRKGRQLGRAVSWPTGASA